MTRRWLWAIDAAILLACLALLLYLYGCSELMVGVRPVVDVPTSRPFVEIGAGPRVYDRWLPYAMTAAALLAWVLPPLWPLMRPARGRPRAEEAS